MVESVELKNFGKHSHIVWDNLGGLNLVLGKNSSGKSFLLKAIYTAMKTIEATGRGNSMKSGPEILAEKLYWTFQAEAIGDLVKKGQNQPLLFKMRRTDGMFSYQYGKDTTKIIKNIESSCKENDIKTIFIPAKEVLSLSTIIKKSREQDEIFGFDDTYLDLVRAISIPTHRGRNSDRIVECRNRLRELVGGSVQYDSAEDIWSFIDSSKNRFSIGTTAEGVKKIAILDQLLGNRYLTAGSVLILDEPESGVHPEAVSELMEILYQLSCAGIQVFIASHSYFVIKKAYVIALRNEADISLLSLEADNARIYNLKKGMPENSIIQESVRLYEEEVEETF